MPRKLNKAAVDIQTIVLGRAVVVYIPRADRTLLLEAVPEGGKKTYAVSVGPVRGLLVELTSSSVWSDFSDGCLVVNANATPDDLPLVIDCDTSAEAEAVEAAIMRATDALHKEIVDTITARVAELTQHLEPETSPSA